jgi:hypothetical protein
MSDQQNDIPEQLIDEIRLPDVTALAVAITLWLSRENPNALEEIGQIADVLKEKFVAGE